jgi:superfamily II DNA/RNA helicase
MFIYLFDKIMDNIQKPPKQQVDGATKKRNYKDNKMNNVDTTISESRTAHNEEWDGSDCNVTVTEPVDDWENGGDVTFGNASAVPDTKNKPHIVQIAKASLPAVHVVPIAKAESRAEESSSQWDAVPEPTVDLDYEASADQCWDDEDEEDVEEFVTHAEKTGDEEDSLQRRFEEYSETVTTFMEMGLHEKIVHALGIIGLENPMLCQKLVSILHNPDGESVEDDISISAQTGRGKTIMALLIILDKILNKYTVTDNEDGTQTVGCDYTNEVGCKAGIIVNSRQLCLQFFQDIEAICTHLGIPIAMHRGVAKEKDSDGDDNTHVNINYMSNFPAIRKNRKENGLAPLQMVMGTETIIIGTPGRLNQLMNPECFRKDPIKKQDGNVYFSMGERKPAPSFGRGSRGNTGRKHISRPLDVKNVLTLFIDEADVHTEEYAKNADKPANEFSLTSLLKRFISYEVEDGVRYKIEPVRFWASATIENSREFYTILEHMGYPIPVTKRIFVPKEKDLISKFYTIVRTEEEKILVTSAIIRKKGNALILFKTSKKCEMVYQFLKENKYPVALYHSDMSTGQKDALIGQFKSCEVKFLCAVGLDRGLDIPSLENVIVYDIPDKPEDYIHQIGRCARGFRKGNAFALIVQLTNNVPKYISHLSSIPNIGKITSLSIDVHSAGSGKSGTSSSRAR